MTASRVEVGGFVAPGFERVAAKFERNFTAHQEVGAAFAATLGGRPVVDLWGGLAAPERGEPWREDTAQVMFSGTKGLVAACLVLLMDRGLLSLDDTVADHWPEFAARGKTSVHVRDVVSHAARLPGLATRVTWQEATDDRRMAALLASQPQCEDERAARTYHAITFGWLCGELVRRVDGRSIGAFFAQEIAAPLGLDLWIGVPEHVEHRIARISVDATWSRAPIARARPDSHDRLLASVFGNPVRFDPADGFPWNEQAWLAAEVPGVNAVGTARSIARLYGELPALLSREGLELACTPLTSRVDPLLGKPMTFGVGFQLQTEDRPFGPPPDGFGHGGTGGSRHGRWPAVDVGFSYGMNELRPERGDVRAAELLTALHESVTALREP